MPINTDHDQNLHGQSLGRFSGNAGNFDKKGKVCFGTYKSKFNRVLI